MSIALGKLTVLSQIINTRWFALADLLLVMMSGVVWVLTPEFGVWSMLIALLPWGCRLISPTWSLKRTSFDWLLVLFLLTAWIGYWAAYDKTAAWDKFWLVVTAVLLYYALSTQPVENLGWLSILLFCTGVGVSIYFFLTADFTSLGKVGDWWMHARPALEWHAIHHGYVSGIVVITTPFVFYWFWEKQKLPLRRGSVFLGLFLLLGLGIVVFAFVLTLSRGILLALACTAGIWASWKILTLGTLAARPKVRTFFPIFVLLCLSVIIALVYLGPALLGENSTQGDFGTNTRSEIFLRGTYFLEDFPIVGGGLNSFPGLYSQYILVIPFYYFANSYNVFLDVAIEQGLIGGLIFLVLYLASIRLLSQSIIATQSPQIRVFSWLSLCALIVAIVHGMLYDYFYNGTGTILLFFPVGISMIGVLNPSREPTTSSFQVWLQKVEKTQVLALVSIIGSALIILLVLSASRIKSIWFANLGAIQLSQVELAGFPTGQWMGTERVPKLDAAEASLHASLRFDPLNRTANHRLGLIYMLRRDFESASIYLERAYQQAPNHRGIIKSLGYCYTWLGAMENARSLLVQIPEAREELDVYTWWWRSQGREDLAEKASTMLATLNSQTGQP